MAGLLDEPYIGYPQLARRRAVPNTDVETSKGLLRGISYYPYDLLGAPIDLMNMAITPLGMGSKTPVMGSEYLQGLAQKAGLSLPKTDSSSENIGRILSSIINPAAGARAVGKVIDPAMQAAAPVGRALGEQAYRRTEDLLQSQGLMPSITAYHGTPHNIQGGFDINKVGTGEGAQAYGYGMYYAQNPAVAKEYQKMLVGPEATAAEYLQMYKTPESAISALEYGITSNLTAEAKKFSEDAINILKSGKELKGNLYKVDVPDQYIPKMIDFDSPISKQPKEFVELLKDVAKNENFDAFEHLALAQTIGKHPRNAPNYKPTGEELINNVSDILGIERNSPEFSKIMKEYGIKGIRYLDQGSRNPGFSSLTPAQLDSRIDGIKESLDAGLGNKEVLERQLKSLQTERDSYKNLTSNFVVFDPTDVKILEKNSQKVESLLD